MTRVISVKSKSKVAPAAVPPKKDKVVNHVLNIINQSSFLIITEALLGINRLHLLQYNQFLTTLTKVYSLGLLCVVLVVNGKFIIMKLSASLTVTLGTFVTEYTTLVMIALTSSQNQLKIFFENLSTFDEILNIKNDLAITCSSKRVVVCTLSCIVSNLFEVFLLMMIFKVTDLYLLSSDFVISASHDIEQVFFFTFLRNIYVRMLIVRAHAAKLFDANDKPENMCDVQKLSEKTQFDVSTLHRVYELLHRCSEQLNATMNVPILLILFVSALSTIMTLKSLVTLVQIENPNLNMDLMTFFVVFRCLKYTLLVIIPCYYSSVTAAQTTSIRTILHDAVNTKPMNKIERRKVKTFFLLTQESDFGYVICGIISLNMSLPLSYMSLCTTYLVIIIQFSKFIE